MGGGRPASPARRSALAGIAGAGLVAALVVTGAARAQAQGEVIVVSRERILREAAASRRLRESETRLTELLQAQIDATKVDFAAQEEELTRVRGELPEADFEARVAAFDERVRLARRVAQERAALLQAAFQEARAVILAALPALMERLRVEAGARIVLNADEVLAIDAARDMTDRAIALFDAEGPPPPLPEIDLSAPLLPPQEPVAAAPSGDVTAPAAQQEQPAR